MAESKTVGEMHQNATLPNGLRRNWTEATGRDPVYQHTWGTRYLCLFVVPVGLEILLGFPASWGTVTGLGLATVCLVAGIGLLSSSHKFALALGLLCQEWTFAESVLSDKDAVASVELDELVEWSLSEMKARATHILRVIAKEITSLEESGQKMEANKIRTGTFSPTHRAFRDLGLADPKWDSYFNPPQAEEEQGKE